MRRLGFHPPYADVDGGPLQQVQLAVAAASPIQILSTYDYGIPVRPIYKSYAVYHPSKEPPGYIDWLERQ